MTPPTASLDEVADALGVTSSALRKMAEEGHFKKPARGRMDVLDVLRGWAARARAQLAEKTNSDERIKRARAEKLELSNDATRRNMIPADEVRRDVTRGFTELKSQLLVIPRQIEMACGREVAERVEKEVLAVLDLMARNEWMKKEKAK